MKKIKKIFSLFSLALIAELTFPTNAFAVISNPIIKNGANQATSPTTYFNIVLSTIFTLFFIVGVVYFIWHIVFAGFHLIASEGDPKKFESGKNEMVYAFVGLFIILSIFAILKFIGTVLGISGLDTLTIKWPTL